METANEIIKQVVPILMIPIKKYLRYLILCSEYMRIMDIKMKELNNVKVGAEEKRSSNTNNRIEVPARVEGWLGEVENINAKVDNVSRDIGSCFNPKIRLRAGRNAFRISEEIDSVMRQYKEIDWPDQLIPPGKVDFNEASTSTPSILHNDFQSREVTFIEALKALNPNNKCHMIALCGMGGVGKTTMMQRLRKAVQEKKMFNFILKAFIGKETNPIAVQDEIAYYLGVKLNEKTKTLRADELRQGFKSKSDGGKSKFFVILDDVWQALDLEDIGLSTLPNQGIDFKILLTTRDEEVCILMGAKADSIITLGLLTNAEAQKLFYQNVETSDLELLKIGENIITKCCGLPIAIKTSACTLINKRKEIWEDALSRLQNHDIENVGGEVFLTSYDNLPDEETKRVFLMCGLFIEGFDIPTEELTRCVWGLRLFHKAYTIREARNRLYTCIERLVQTNLLLEGDDGMHVKMHGMVRDFVLGSTVEHASIVNHGNMCGWSENDMIDSCKTISLTCKGMSKVLGDLKFPNLTMLKLMHGDKSLSFPQDFYQGMEKLEVISYDYMKYPLLPPSPQCSTNLRVLHLHECSLMFDCSSIGNLFNLEVLSFSNCYNCMLPSTIGNLKKLRLLDLTNCYGLHIDYGVLRNLVKLEELYMRLDNGGITFTEENYNVIAELIENLSVLELNFLERNVTSKNTSFKKTLFKKLQSFKISMVLEQVSVGYLRREVKERVRESENELFLATNKADVHGYRMNELFEKTVVLGLCVGDMYYLEELVDARSVRPPQSSSFYNLRVLFVSECAKLRYLFTPGVANSLSKLEYLKVCECDDMEELIHTNDSEEETITFPKLKLLSVCGLPKLLGLCHIIDLPELVELEIEGIPGIRSIYPKNKLETSSLLKEEVVIPKLRKISVGGCDNLVNLFPCNPIPLLHNLEELIVKRCGSIEVLFDIDLDSAGKIGEGSNLRSIEVDFLGKLREVWKINGVDNSDLLISGFQAVESIKIENCVRFRNVFTPITTNFDMGALMDLSINTCGENRRNNESEKSSQEEEQTGIISKEETTQVTDSISIIALPFSLTHSFHNLRKLDLRSYKGMEVVFDIESLTSRELVSSEHNQQRLLSNLEELILYNIDSMRHVWKCNWNKFMILQKQQHESPFHNLTTIQLYYNKRITYLFSPLMAKLLSNLKEVKIGYCGSIEEVLSKRDDEDKEKTTFTSTSSHTSTTLFPHLESLILFGLNNLKCIGGGGAKDGSNEVSIHYTTTTSAFVDQFKLSQAGGFSWSLCQYAREIHIKDCNALSSVIPCYAVGQMQKLHVLEVHDCKGLKEVFETQAMISNSSNNGCDEGTPRLNHVIMLPNLKILKIIGCDSLEHIFTVSTLESLRQLEELVVYSCKAMKVVVKEEEEEDDGAQKRMASSKVVVLPRLKSIALEDLPDLVGFFLGKNEFHWPSLDEVTIKKCPKMMVFASGGSTAPRLHSIHTSLGQYSLEECGLNFHVASATHHQIPVFPSVEGTSLFPASTPEGTPWSFHNLIEFHMEDTYYVKHIIPSNGLLQLQKLEKIRVSNCGSIEEVFEEWEGTNSSSSGVDKSQAIVVKLPSLRQVELMKLRRLRSIWKSNQWTVFEFPNLTTLSICDCKILQHVFSSSMVGSLLQLQELHITQCARVEVIVKDENVGVQEREEEFDGKTSEITLPSLKYLRLQRLPCLKGFCLGKEDFSFPLLDTLKINKCREITTFTNGNSATPQLKELSIFGAYYVAGEDINSFIKAKREMGSLR